MGRAACAPRSTALRCRCRTAIAAHQHDLSARARRAPTSTRACDLEHIHTHTHTGTGAHTHSVGLYAFINIHKCIIAVLGRRRYMNSIELIELHREHRVRSRLHVASEGCLLELIRDDVAITHTHARGARNNKLNGRWSRNCLIYGYLHRMRARIAVHQLLWPNKLTECANSGLPT